jgi:energy-converting hydrogenase Eha subunit A
MRKSVALLLVLVFLVASCLCAVPSVNAADVVEDSWETMASMPTARNGLGVAVVNGKIYAIGGQNMGGVLGVNEMYDPATNTWITKKSMPTPRANFATAVFHNKIYCIGGLFPISGVNEVYDPVTDTWETKQPMPTPRGALSASVVNNKIYLIGGFVPSSIGLPTPERSNLNEMYDPVTDSWTTMAPLPTAVVYTISTVVDNKIYVFGNGDTPQIYDPQTNTWRYGPSMPYSVSYGAVAATTGVCAAKKIYRLGGYVYSDELDPETSLPKRGPLTQIFDPKTGTWSIGATMHAPRILLSVAVVDDLLYAIGGQNHNGDLIIYDVNDRYTPLGYGTPDPSYDATPPEITLISPENKTYHETSVPLEIPLEFSVDEQAFRVWYKLDGENNTEITGNTTLTDLTDGVHNVTVYAADQVGNVGASETVTFTIAEPEPFPTVPVAAVSVATAAVVGVGLLVYFRRRSHRPESLSSNLD